MKISEKEKVNNIKNEGLRDFVVKRVGETIKAEIMVMSSCYFLNIEGRSFVYYKSDNLENDTDILEENYGAVIN